MRPAVAAIFLLLALFPGCIHLTNEQDCSTTSADDRNDCYFDLAIRYAIVEQDAGRAVAACNRIGAVTFGDDRAQCIAKVADIMEDPTICNNIGESILEDGVNSLLIRNLCIDEAKPRG